MKTHEEILEPYVVDYPNGASIVAKPNALKAMQQAVDQALMWKPVDAGNLPDVAVLCKDIDGVVTYGYLNLWHGLVCCGTAISEITDYFDPAKLKTP